MTQYRPVLSIVLLVIIAVQSSFGQMMMLQPNPLMANPRLAMMRHPRNHPMRPIFSPAGIAPAAPPTYAIAEARIEPDSKEPISEEKWHEKIKDLEIMKQDIHHKQLALQDKLTILDDQVMNFQKQIAVVEDELHKLDELERCHSAEQIRLERMIQQHRMTEYQQRLVEERMARQRAAIEEWNSAQKERQRMTTDSVGEQEWDHAPAGDTVRPEESSKSNQASQQNSSNGVSKMPTGSQILNPQANSGLMSRETRILKQDSLSTGTNKACHQLLMNEKDVHAKQGIIQKRMAVGSSSSPGMSNSTIDNPITSHNQSIKKDGAVEMPVTYESVHGARE